MLCQHFLRFFFHIWRISCAQNISATQDLSIVYKGSYAVVYRNYLVQNVTYKKIMRLSLGRQKELVSVNHCVAPHNSLMFLNNGRSCMVHVISNFFEERYSVIG